MSSWQKLPELSFAIAGPIARAFLDIGVENFRDAGRYLDQLGYGRNSKPDEFLNVLHEGRGTCSTKHALFAALAEEQAFPIDLMLGLFEMNGSNTPQIAGILAGHGLASIPEAHCYLIYDGEIVDLTGLPQGETPVGSFLQVAKLSARDIAACKRSWHIEQIGIWLSAKSPALANLNTDDIWRVREECIDALSAAYGS